MAMNNKGFTLTEMLMSVAILGILSSVTPMLMVQFQRFSRLMDSKVAIQRDSRFALDVITRQIRQAKSGTIIISSKTNQPPFSMISFTTADGRDISFYQEGKYLYGSIGGTISKFSENMRFIAFSFPRSDNARIVSVALTTEKATYEGATKALTLSVEKVRVMN